MQCCLLKAKLSFCLEPTLLQDSAKAAWCISPKQQLIDSDPIGCPGVPLKIHDNTMTFVLWTEAQWPGLDLFFKGTDWNLRRSQRKLALQRKASKWNLMHWESFSKLSMQKVSGVVVCFFTHNALQLLSDRWPPVSPLHIAFDWISYFKTA